MRRALVLGCLVLVGCKLGPDHVPPELDLPAGYPSAPAADRNLAALEWRTLYADPALAALITRALEQNLDLAIAVARLREARSALTIARAPLYPDIALGLNAERERESELTGGSDDESDTLVLQGLLAWELDLFGFNRRAAEAADAELAAQQFDVYDVQVALIGAVAELYFSLQALNRQIGITEATITTRAETLRIQKRRNTAGVISGLEVAQAQVALAEAERTLPGQVNERDTTAYQLRVLLGDAPDAVAAEWTPAQRQYPEGLPAGLPADLLQRRPDIRRAEQVLAAATARIGQAQANRFPRIVLTGAYGRESEDLDDLLDSNGLAWIATFDVLQPLFNAGANKAAVAVAEAQFEQARLGYQAAVLRGLAEVATAINTYERASEATAATLRLKQAAEEYLNLAGLRYGNGVLGYIDVLDAQRQFFGAQLELINAERDQRLAIAFLYRALGGGWTPPESAES